MTQTLSERTETIVRSAHTLTPAEVQDLDQLGAEPLGEETLRYATHHGVLVEHEVLGPVRLIECPGGVRLSSDYVLVISERYGVIEVLAGHLRVGAALAWQLTVRASLDYELDALTY